MDAITLPGGEGRCDRSASGARQVSVELEAALQHSTRGGLQRHSRAERVRPLLAPRPEPRGGVAVLTKVERLKCLWMAPFTLHRNLLRALENEVRIAASGKPARVIAKMNALTDEATINALCAASQAGV